MSGLVVPPNGTPPALLGSDDPDAVTLGRLVSSYQGIGGKMRYGGERHVLVFGANGTGKGTRILVPNLLEISGCSVVVVDPKGELAAITAPYRRQLGRVVILNPFGVLTDIPGYQDLKSEGYNPLVALDPASPNFNSDAALLADALVTVGGKDPHWDESARALLGALIMYVAMEARGLVKEPFQIKDEPISSTPTMARVRALLCQPSGKGDREAGYQLYGLPVLANKMTHCGDVGLSNKASQFARWSEEIESIVSAAKRQTESFDDKPMREDMARGRFDFREMKRQPVTVYLILPPQMMERHSKWLRLVLTAAIQGVMRPRGRGEPKTLFMMDEFFVLGHLQIIATVWALARGYGIQFMPVLQDTHQLKKLYGEMWETFLGMAGVSAFFTPNDMTTADWMSRRAGDTTQVAMNYTKNDGSSGDRENKSEGFSYSPVKVPLVSAHKLFGMQPGYMQLVIAGLENVVAVYAPSYFDEITRCMQRMRPNPYVAGL